MLSSNLKIGLVGFNEQQAKVFTDNGFTIRGHIYTGEKQKEQILEATQDKMSFRKWESYDFPNQVSQTLPYETIEKIKNKIFDTFVRCTDRWAWSSEHVRNWNDYDHLFRIACAQNYGWLIENKIECLVYYNIPHQGMALVQYTLAKELGIKTLIFNQSLFPGRCFLVEDWNDIGHFKTAQRSDTFPIDISAPTKPPFYMSSVKSDTKRKTRNIIKKFRARTLVTLGLTGFNKENRRKSFHRNARRWQDAVENDRYYEAASALFKDKIVNESYVYFPLHLQPEMTTDVLGGKYADQLLALETLREITPNHIAIYVKENPKQTGKIRSESFFKRIQQIPNLKFIAHKESSFELIENSIAVSTITGTAGWEALRMKKPVLVFGSIFWNCFPGAFHISKKPEWKDIESFKFNSEKLQTAANEISKYAHDGISDTAYSVQVENFDEKENAMKLCTIIQNHLA